MDVPAEPVTQARRGPALAVAAVAIAVVAVLGLGVLAKFAPQMQWDATVSRALYAGDYRVGALNGLLEVLTAPGSAVFRLIVFLPVLVLLVRARAWWTAAWVLTAITLIGPLTTLLKDLFGRIRPDFPGGGARYSSLSYPSGHSSGIATLVTVALILAWPYLTGPTARRIALAAGAALVLLVGLTRMWLGVHFFSDVVGGWALGIAWSLLTAVAFSALPGGRAALPGRR